MTQATVSQAFNEIEPIMKEINRLMVTCPIEGKDKIFFATLVAATIIGGACAVIKKESHMELKDAPLSMIADRLMALVIPQLQAQEHGEKH